MSTILISLVVVGGAIAVVLWITVGDTAQPATQDPEEAGAPPEALALGPVVVHVEAGVVVPEDEWEEEPEPDEHADEPEPDGEDADDATTASEPLALAEPPAPQPTPERTAAPEQHEVLLPGRYSFDPVPPVTWARRLRSALGVVLMVVVVGLALAAAVGVIVVFISRALEGAVS